jgi:hypothetical protein
MSVKRALAFVVSLTALAGCTAVLGVRDIYLDPSAGEGGLDGAVSPDGSPTPEGGAPDTGPPVDCAGADLQTDAKHCGRCGHDCLGGKCEAGVCKAVLLVPGLDQPVALAVDAQSIFVTQYGSGTIIQTAKDGTGPKPVITGQPNVQGVVIDGQTLYWSNRDFPADGNMRKGGVYKCTLPTCTAQLVSAANFAVNVTKFGDQLFFGGNNESKLYQVKTDGTGRIELDATINKPFGVATDGAHVYFTSQASTFYRVPVGGGALQAMGSAAGPTVGLTVVDATRVYWTTGDKVLGLDKATPQGVPTNYFSGGQDAAGLAVDDVNVYWTNYLDADGDLRFCPKVGNCQGGGTALAGGMIRPFTITTDATAVYWVEEGLPGAVNGRLWKIAKP